MGDVPIRPDSTLEDQLAHVKSQVTPWCKLQYKHAMLKQRYDLLKDHYSQLTSGMNKSQICESHL